MDQEAPHEAPAGSASQQPTAGEELLQVVSFRVGDEEFGLDILRVQEIIRYQRLTRLPNAPAFVEGVINLRGKVIPVVGLRKRLAISHEPADGETRIVVLEVQNTIVGFIVDSVPEVLRIPSTAVAPPPRLGNGEREYVSGVARLNDRLLMLLAVDRILTGQESKAAIVAQA
jgi:purine-binding chemotaxis protein CheW